jgi:fumarylacetoacetase
MMIPIVPVPSNSDFSLHNLPFGVFSTVSDERRRCATRLGDTVIDLEALESAGLFEDVLWDNGPIFFGATHLNRFLELPKSKWLALRQRLQELLNAEHSNSLLKHYPNLSRTAFFDIQAVQLHLPILVGDYTDFYSSRYHAENVGEIFRNSRDLQPNWKHLPVAYHGRASTVVVSGREIIRPNGQYINSSSNSNDNFPIHGPTQQLDFEVELATVLGGFPSDDSYYHPPLTMEMAENHIFGFLLMNDWSARDLQRWEYVPLGPFTAKNFCTTVSPWIVMAEALTKVDAVELQDSSTLEYLREDDQKMYDIRMTASIITGLQATETVVCTTNAKYLYWSVVQQLVHHSVSGCQMKTGDILGSGTISSPTCGGSMLEVSKNGTRPICIGTNESRSFLHNGDTVILRGVSGSGHTLVGFGDCRGTIVSTQSTSTERSPTTPSYIDLALYGYWKSSAIWRVRIALAAKKIPYTVIPLDVSKGEQTSISRKLLNPIGQVPLLECTNAHSGKRFRIAQSLAIIQFLEDAFPNTVPLWPHDPAEKAFANQIVEIVNAGTQPLLEEQSEGTLSSLTIGRFADENGLAAVETLLAAMNRPGPYAVSFRPSIVDIFLIPLLSSAKDRYGIDTSASYPVLDSIHLVCSEHPWFIQTHPTLQPDAPKD